ncbi:PAS domain S-box protein [Hyphomicrobium sp. D-2]|uniref:PAS domain S-box protein n=1 Tax=Hyphomicrobium sp. D-2 TaxID=3041621 RepID=UPI0024581052|nr:PAS domain S-box protein [Hyphomicrobium sp. D-2]MDH4980998.1 PAS domain S-box protein [Hyphomicrobium sp. D-2]
MSFDAQSRMLLSGAGERSGWPRPFSAPALMIGLLLSLIGIFCVLGLLLWLIDTDEREARREEIIRDALWVEHTLQFRFGAIETRLARMAYELGRADVPLEIFNAQASALVHTDREIWALSWLDDSEQAIATVPATRDGNAPLDPLVRSAIVAVKRTGRGTFTAPYARETTSDHVSYVAPIVQDSNVIGTLHAEISLSRMLSQHVPWWIAEKRAVLIKRGDERLAASRSKVDPDDSALSYTVEIGSPLNDLWLTLASYRNRSSLTQNGLVIAMIVLSCLAAGALIARERQLRGRKLAEAARDEEYAFRRSMEESLRIGIRARDLDGRLLYVNGAFCRMVGYTEAELIGQGPPMPYWVPDEIERTQRIHDAVLAGASSGQGIAVKFQRRDGSRLDVLIYEAPLLDAQGQQQGWIGSVLDVSDRKRAEELERAHAEKLQHTSRLITMGEMASFLAHDLNQPLAAIRSYQTGLKNMLESGAMSLTAATPVLDAIGKSVERAGLMIRRVHNFVKKSEPRLEPLNLAEAVKETVALLEPELTRARCSVDVALAPGLPPVRADRVLIEQVLVNLIRNSLDACKDLEPHRRRVSLSAGMHTGTITVSVRDWGNGVPDTVASQLFSPFVSTKEGGMGMGLTICRSIIELHGGHIEYRREPDDGSRFTIILPTADRAANE